MRRSIFALLFLACSSIAIVSLHSQVAPAGIQRVLDVRVGGFGSVFQPDYAGEGIAQTSPNRLYGAGAFLDARFTRWIQPEAETRWLRFNEYLGIDENTYSFGERLPIVENWHRFTPYGKLLVGVGDGSFLTGSCFVLTYGGGVDIRLSHRFNLRAFDFEYQQWHVTPTLWPYGGSVGVSYRVF